MSPIKGLSETRRLPRLGKIHLGIKKSKMVNGREVTFPSAVDYFVFPEESPLYSDLVNVFSQKPRELRILIPVEDEERWCSQYYRAYSQTRGLICKGDGETAIRMVDIQTGAMADRSTSEAVLREVPCPGRDCPDYEQQCREIMNLQFLLPEIPGLGVWQIDTSSINSIRNINSAADLIRRIYGRASMIPLLLTIEPQEVQDTEGKKRTVNVLNLRTNRTLLEMMETVTKPAAQMLAAGTVLPEPDDEVPEMVIPQIQEEKVTPAERKKDKVQPETAPTASEPTDLKQKSAPAESASSQDKRKLVSLMREKGLNDEQMRQVLYEVTGKKGNWTRSDLEEVERKLKEDRNSAEAEADDFLKEMDR